MTQLPARVLAQCLDAVDRGEAALEECLARYPQHDEELMPILRIATMLRDDPSAGPRPSFRRTARHRLLAKLPPRTPARPGAVTWPLWQTLSRRAAAAWVAIVVSLAVLLGSSGIVYATVRTLPGDTLYPVKTTVEEARLWVARGEDDVHLSLQFAENRIQEIRRLGTTGRFHDVTTAAGRFGAQLRRTDRALLELAERDAELAAALTAKVEETRTHYRRELTGLLRMAPDVERPTIEGILDLDDDLYPHDLFDDDDEQEVPPPTGTDDGSPERQDDAFPDDDDPFPATEPLEVDEDDGDDSGGDDIRDDPDGTDDAPERREPEGDAGTMEEPDDGEEHGTGDDPEGAHDPEPREPERDHPSPDDDDPGSSPEPGDPGDGDGRADDDLEEPDGSGKEDDSSEHDGSDSGEHDGSDSGEHDGSDPGDASSQDERSDGEHDGEDEPDD